MLQFQFRVNCGLAWTARMLYPDSFPLLASAVVGWSLLTERNGVYKEIIWKTNVYEFRREVNNSWVCSMCYSKYSERNCLFGWKTRYLCSLGNTWLQWPIPWDWWGRQIWLKAVQPLWAKEVKNTVTQLASPCFVQRTLKVLSNQKQVLLSSRALPLWERSGGKALWDCSGAAGHVGYGTDAWLKACTKSWALLCFWERFATNACKLPGVGFRTDLIKDCTDSLSARNGKYWSETIFRDTAGILKPAHVVLGSVLTWTAKIE